MRFTLALVLAAASLGAAPSKNPFAGRYSSSPAATKGQIKIGAHGAISGQETVQFSVPGYSETTYHYTYVGEVSAEGEMTVGISYVVFVSTIYGNWFDSDGYSLTAHAELDADGNLVARDDTGLVLFVWSRQ